MANEKAHLFGVYNARTSTVLSLDKIFYARSTLDSVK